MTRYDGPIIDAHHHLWDLSLGRHPWLTSEAHAIKALGDIGFLRHDYLPRDYLADIGRERVVASVCIEAVWDRTRPPVEEVEWLERLERPGGIAARCIAWADLRSASAETTLAALAAHRGVVGIRESIRWHPDPAKRWAERGIVEDAAWRRGLVAAERHSLHLELLMNTHQADEVARLARDFPEQTFVVNHCGTPTERDREGLHAWRDGLRLMAAQPNVQIKLSGYASYAADRSLPAMRAVVDTVLDAFGTERAMFGTDYPVARRHMSFADICGCFKDIVANLSPEQQRALFHDNAARTYRFAALA
ncbi:MAG: amidohydrolase family protein [Acidisphaera sp.]|nr:amidohydrolase family protein [Acidisphaera sp.]MBV9813544.1 amidohydrolase family protein [Acetobacteraceae bacterium]